ncbi:MAG: endonuclease domain-containing protein [Parcubacteria group bacterium]|nr:endonuclease domain-containing protein [Parcubacteria group bacterium]
MKAGTLRLFNNSGNKTLRRRLRKSQTDAEKKLWNRLRKHQIKGGKFFRQYGVGVYVLDFYAPQQRLAIELDGGQHLEENQRNHDKLRLRFLDGRNIRVVRFWDTDVLKNIEGVLEEIEKCITPPYLPLS